MSNNPPSPPKKSLSATGSRQHEVQRGKRKPPPTITLTCARCGELFEKNLYTYRADRKKILLGKRGIVKIVVDGRTPSETGPQGQKGPKQSRPQMQDADTWYCSLSCARAWEDDFTPWKFMFTSSKSGATRRGIPFNLEIEDIMDQWEKQKGICPYSGIKMLMPKTYNDYKYYKPTMDESIIDREPASRGKNRADPRTASLDRLVSRDEDGKPLPYDIENIELVCLSIQYAKNDWPVEVFKKFLSEIKIGDQGAWDGII